MWQFATLPALPGRWRPPQATRAFGTPFSFQPATWRSSTGTLSAAPSSVGMSPGTISSSAAARQTIRSQGFISTSRNLLNTAASKVMPSTQPVNVTPKSNQVKPLATSSRLGENTKTKGTSALAMPRRKAVLPVLNGSPPAMPAAA